jgi:hypothetical protein
MSQVHSLVNLRAYRGGTFTAVLLLRCKVGEVAEKWRLPFKSSRRTYATLPPLQEYRHQHYFQCIYLHEYGSLPCSP